MWCLPLIEYQCYALPRKFARQLMITYISFVIPNDTMLFLEGLQIG